MSAHDFLVQGVFGPDRQPARLWIADGFIHIRFYNHWFTRRTGARAIHLNDLIRIGREPRTFTDRIMLECTYGDYLLRYADKKPARAFERAVRAALWGN